MIYDRLKLDFYYDLAYSTPVDHENLKPHQLTDERVKELDEQKGVHHTLMGMTKLNKQSYEKNGIEYIVINDEKLILESMAKFE